MKNPLLLLALAMCLASSSAFSRPQTAYQPQEGDFVFQSLPHGDLVDAIEGASNSPYSHVGLVLKKQGTWHVREAIGEVSDTPLPEWINRGRGHAFDAYRLKAPFQKHIPAFIQASQAFVGRPYDYQYDMDDAKI